eukprot:5842061-Pleurochrysis_carterae.AAC.2
MSRRSRNAQADTQSANVHGLSHCNGRRRKTTSTRVNCAKQRVTASMQLTECIDVRSHIMASSLLLANHVTRKL